MRMLAVAGCLYALVWSSPALRADDADTTKPQTHKVVKGPLNIVITLEGVFEPRQSEEIVLRPESWTELTVRKAVEPGTVVKAGERLLSLDTTKLDEAIRDAETTVKTERLELDELAAEIRVLEQTTPQELAQAEREKGIAAADYKYFTETERDLEVKQYDFMLKMYGNYLEYAKEELRQLEKMYRADDLMEETEEIILKQQRDQVEQITFMVDVGRLQRDRIVQTELPRREQSLREAVERTAIANDKAERTLPLALVKLRLRIVKSNEEQRRNEEKLAKLRHDLELLAVKSPAAGVVYYGECRNGNWTHPEMATKLRRGGSVTAHEVLMTVVPLRPLVVRATVPEKELSQVKSGLAGKVIATAWPELKLKGTVERLALLPDPAGKFIAHIKLDEATLPPEALAPGMDCSVKLTAHSQNDALTVPAKAVFADDLDEDRHYVYLSTDGKPSRQNVTPGHRTEERVEITDGLKEGDLILLQRPDE